MSQVKDEDDDEVRVLSCFCDLPSSGKACLCAMPTLERHDQFKDEDVVIHDSQEEGEVHESQEEVPMSPIYGEEFPPKEELEIPATQEEVDPSERFPLEEDKGEEEEEEQHRHFPNDLARMFIIAGRERHRDDVLAAALLLVEFDQSVDVCRAATDEERREAQRKFIALQNLVVSAAVADSRPTRKRKAAVTAAADRVWDGEPTQRRKAQVMSFAERHGRCDAASREYDKGPDYSDDGWDSEDFVV